MIPHAASLGKSGQLRRAQSNISARPGDMRATFKMSHAPLYKVPEPESEKIRPSCFEKQVIQTTQTSRAACMNPAKTFEAASALVTALPSNSEDQVGKFASF